MKIPSNNLLRQYQMFKQEYDEKAIQVLNSGYYILGNEVKEFEKEFAHYVGAQYCVGLASGLDALVLAFRALGVGEGDEVLVQGNTYIASVMGISMNGATPIFIEPNQYYNIDSNVLEERITEKTKAILVVHLYGQATKMDKIKDVCKKYNLYLVEDCAQSHGAQYKWQMTGSFGDIGCFSFYPSKNLGAFGDAGAITTNNEDLAKKIKVLRNYGSEKRYHNMVVGYNSRLDELQAGLLRVKLQHIEELEEERKNLANRYLNEIKNEKLILPELDTDCSHVYHLFVVRAKSNREQWLRYLEEKEIQIIVHYPIPPHLSEAYRYLGVRKGSLPITEEFAESVFTLPLYNGMKKDEQDYVINCLNEF